MTTQPSVAPLTDEQLTKLVWDLAPGANAESVLIRFSGPYDIAQPSYVLRELADRIALLSEARPAPDRDPRMESASWLLENRWITYADYEKARAALSGHST